MDFKEMLVELVKAAGMELVNRAEDIVGDPESLTDMDIWIRFPNDSYPSIDVSKTYIPKEVTKIVFPLRR